MINNKEVQLAKNKRKKKMGTRGVIGKASKKKGCLVRG